jgi:DNA ligase 1
MSASKFLDGKQNVVQAKSKQSTLAFGQKAGPKKEASVGGENDRKVVSADKSIPNGSPASPVSNRQLSESPAPKPLKREKSHQDEDDDDSDDQPVVKRIKKTSTYAAPTKPTKAATNGKKSGKPSTANRVPAVSEDTLNNGATSDKSEVLSEEDEASPDEMDEKPADTIKKHEKLQATLKGSSKDPYPDWKAGDPVPYAALCATFALIDMTTKRLEISAHCSLFLQQVLRLTPGDLTSTVQLMINKVAADYAGIELGIGESLILKAISETTGRTLTDTKADHHKIGDLGLVAAKSRSNQRTMFTPKPLTVKGVHEGLLAIASLQGHGAHDRKVNSIKKLLSSADAANTEKGEKGLDITKEKGGASESKFLIRFLEGKLRLGLAEKTVIVALAQAMVKHEAAQKGNKLPSTEQMAKGEAILKTVYR